MNGAFVWSEDIYYEEVARKHLQTTILKFRNIKDESRYNFEIAARRERELDNLK